MKNAAIECRYRRRGGVPTYLRADRALIVVVVALVRSSPAAVAGLVPSMTSPPDITQCADKCQLIVAMRVRVAAAADVQTSHFQTTLSTASPVMCPVGAHDRPGPARDIPCRRSFALSVYSALVRVIILGKGPGPVGVP